jgi:hypothetical protein
VRLYGESASDLLLRLAVKNQADELLNVAGIDTADDLVLVTPQFLKDVLERWPIVCFVCLGPLDQ